MAKRPQTSSHAIQLFEPPADAVYTIDATARMVDIPRRTILVYCKHRLLSPAFDTVDHGYYFDRDSIRALRRIEALRSVCGNDFAGIKIILDLTAALERLRSDTLSLARPKDTGLRQKERSRHPNNFISKDKRDVQLSQEAKVNGTDTTAPIDCRAAARRGALEARVP